MVASPLFSDRKHAHPFGSEKIESSTYLEAAFDEIERANHGVSEAAGEDASHHAFTVVREIVSV